MYIASEMLTAIAPLNSDSVNNYNNFYGMDETGVLDDIGSIFFPSRILKPSQGCNACKADVSVK